jgi:5-formaminoimidazole-4-carboxamide-1-beta-D-ribofuranosyl 5'-monophosphate synthetase
MLFMYGFRHLLKLESSPIEENVWITKEAMEHKKKWKIVKSILKLNFKNLLKLTLKQNLNTFFLIKKMKNLDKENQDLKKKKKKTRKKRKT